MTGGAYTSENIDALMQDSLRNKHAILTTLKALPFAADLRVFGSAAAGKEYPTDIDCFLDLRDLTWKQFQEHPAARALLAISKANPGGMDPFVLTAEGLLTRTEFSSGWQLASNAKAILTAALKNGRTLDDINLTPLKAPKENVEAKMAAEGITKQDIMAIRPILRTWIGGGWTDGPQLARLLAKHEQTLAKFKPTRPVRLWRNERTPAPNGYTGIELNNHGAEDQYTRPTAWSMEKMSAETYASGTGRTLVTALVPPEDIYCSIPLVDYWCGKLGLKPIDEHRQAECIVKPNPSFVAQIRRPVARKDEQALRQELEQVMLAAYLPELAKAQSEGRKVISEQELRQRLSGVAKDTNIEDLPEKIREWQGRKVASAFYYGVTAAFTYKPKREWRDYTLVLLDVDKVEASYSKDENFYVGPQGAGGIGTRYQRFQKWLEENPNTPIDPPMIGLTPSGTIMFGDGRHRWAVLRDMGEKRIPALVPREDLKVMQEKFGVGSGEAKVASKTLYHGTSLAKAKKIMAEGLEPQVGSLVQTAYGDNEDYDFEPLAFAADKQGINQGVYSAMLHAISAEGHDTTNREQAIRNYGAIVVLKDGEEKMEHRPDGEGAEFDYSEHPLQVETGDYYSREGLVPDYVITGPALVRFFKRNGGVFLHRGLNPKKVNALIGMVKKAHPGLEIEKIVEKVWSLDWKKFQQSWDYYSKLPTSKAASTNGWQAPPFEKIQWIGCSPRLYERAKKRLEGLQFPLTLYRAVKIRSEADLWQDRAGIYWTEQLAKAAFYTPAGKTAPGSKFVLRTEVQPHQIDWDSTFNANCEPQGNTGTREQEIKLHAGTPLMINAILAPGAVDFEPRSIKLKASEKTAAPVPVPHEALEQFIPNLLNKLRQRLGQMTDGDPTLGHLGELDMGQLSLAPLECLVRFLPAMKEVLPGKLFQAGRADYKPRRITIRLNPQMRVSEVLSYLDTPQAALECMSVLLHEVTHLVQHRSKTYDNSSVGAYVNNRMEVEAFIQQAVHHAINAFPQGSHPEEPEILAEMQTMPFWDKWVPSMTQANKQEVLKEVYKALTRKRASVRIVYHGGNGDFDRPKRQNGILWTTPDQHIALNYSNTYWRKGPSSLWAIQLNPSSRIVALWDLNNPVIRQIKDQVASERKMQFGVGISDTAWDSYADFSILEQKRWVTDALKKARVDAVWVHDTEHMGGGDQRNSLAILSDRAITTVTNVTATVPKTAGRTCEGCGGPTNNCKCASFVHASQGFCHDCMVKKRKSASLTKEDIEGRRDALLAFFPADLIQDAIDDAPGKTAGLSGFNVNDDEFPWTQWILEGRKTIETRNSPSLSAHIGERVGIVRTVKRGGAALVGYCVLGQPKVYRSNEEFRADDALHLVPQGPGYDIPPGEVKYGYPISNVEPCEPQRVSAQGRVWRRLASMKTAKPTDALLIQRYKATPEELQACKLVDDGDYLEWVVKAMKKELIKLPEDGPKVKEWLGRFTKLKRSPRFTGNKDINAYTPAKLFQAIQENSGAVSVREEKREIVQAAEVWSGSVFSPVLRDVQVSVYKITDPKNAAIIAGGPSITPEGRQQGETGWCTVDEETAASYLEKGPLWVIKVNGKNYCQIHVESDQMMDANDDNIRSGFGVPGVSVRIQIIDDPVVIAAIKGAHIPVKDAIDDGTPGTPLHTAKEIMGAIKGPTSIKDMGTEMPKITPEQLKILMTAPTICATVWIATLGFHWPPMLSYFLEHFDQCREALTRYLPVGRLQKADADYLIANPVAAMKFVYNTNARIGGGLGAKYYAMGRGRQEDTPEDAQMVAVQRAMLAAEPERFVDMEAKKFFDCWWNPLAAEFMQAVTALKVKLSPYQLLGWLRWLGYHKEVLASFPPGGLTDQQQEDLLASGGFNITEDAIGYWAKMGQPIPAFFARAIREGQSDIPVGPTETPEQAAKGIYDKALGEMAHA